MFRRALLLFAMFVSATCIGMSEPDAIGRMSFLVGTWSGSGWIEVRGQRFSFNIVEIVQPKLNGSVLQIDGLSDNHRASTTLWFDNKTSSFRWESHTFTQAGSDFFDVVPELGDGTLIWRTPKNDRSGLFSRFTIALNENGQWFEIGEQSSDGVTWSKFMEQTLSKVH